MSVGVILFHGRSGVDGEPVIRRHPARLQTLSRIWILTRKDRGQPIARLRKVPRAAPAPALCWHVGVCTSH